MVLRAGTYVVGISVVSTVWRSFGDDNVSGQGRTAEDAQVHVDDLVLANTSRASTLVWHGLGGFQLDYMSLPIAETKRQRLIPISPGNSQHRGTIKSARK